MLKQIIETNLDLYKSTFVSIMLKQIIETNLDLYKSTI